MTLQSVITRLELLSDAIFTSLDILCVFGTVIPTHSKDFFPDLVFQCKGQCHRYCCSEIRGNCQTFVFSQMAIYCEDCKTEWKNRENVVRIKIRKQ